MENQTLGSTLTPIRLLKYFQVLVMFHLKSFPDPRIQQVHWSVKGVVTSRCGWGKWSLPHWDWHSLQADSSTSPLGSAPDTKAILFAHSGWITSPVECVTLRHASVHGRWLQTDRKRDVVVCRWDRICTAQMIAVDMVSRMYNKAQLS